MGVRIPDPQQFKKKFLQTQTCQELRTANITMTKANLVKLKFKPGAKQIWLDWSEELKRRRDEVIATLKNEGVVSESCFISEDGEYVYYFMESDDFEKVRKAVTENPHPIDADHKKARESSLELAAKLECLFHFDNRD